MRSSIGVCSAVGMTTILNYQLPVRLDSIGNGTIELVDLKNVGVAIEFASLSCMGAKL